MEWLLKIWYFYRSMKSCRDVMKNNNNWGLKFRNKISLTLVSQKMQSKVKNKKRSMKRKNKRMIKLNHRLMQHILAIKIYNNKMILTKIKNFSWSMALKKLFLQAKIVKCVKKLMQVGLQKEPIIQYIQLSQELKGNKFLWNKEIRQIQYNQTFLKYKINLLIATQKWYNLSNNLNIKIIIKIW